jgi:uncharacterized damage-inducible protein DinB
MTTRSMLLTELEFICRNCARLIGQVEAAQYRYRPPAAEGVNIRTMLELANHLAQIPSIDLAIIRSLPEEDIQRLERELWQGEALDLKGVLREGFEETHRFMEKLSISEFETGSATAYYGRTQTYAQWLLEVITHLYHHRSQLFTYLKLTGAPVDMRGLYSNS